MKNKVRITRSERSDQGTFGVLLTNSGFTCWTGELPWRNNQTGVSCIPAGTYFCHYLLSPSKGMCYHVQNVPGRTHILFHSANWMGDVSKGLKSQLNGCIALGVKVGPLEGQKALLSSKISVTAFVQDLKEEPFELTIVEAY